MYILKFVKNCHYASKMLNIKIPLLNTKKNRALVLSSFSPTQLFATLWNVAHMAPLSMGFSRQEHWSGLPCPLPGDVPNPGIKPGSPILQADSLPSEPPGKSVIVICTENNARREEEMCVRRS